LTRVDFYRLSGGGEDPVLEAACRVAGKAYESGYYVQLLVAERDRRERADERLWTFRDGAFIPHALAEAADPEEPEPVLLAAQPDAGSGTSATVLVAASPPATEDAGAFPRVAEFVPQDPQGRQSARDRYAAYRSLGLELHTHDLRLN
jgi:DNA polymerase-3 subunit chi